MINQRRLKQRYLREHIFKGLSLGACIIVFGFLITLFTGIINYGTTGFLKTEINLDIDLKSTWIDYDEPTRKISHFNYEALILSGLHKALHGLHTKNITWAEELISSSARKNLYTLIKKRPKYIDQTRNLWLAASDEVDAYIKGKLDPNLAEEDSRLHDQQIRWVQILQDDNHIRKRFNRSFFTDSDSREPVTAGILGAAIGSLYLMLVTLIISVPLGVAAAVYLEEFSRKNYWAHLIEVCISNLAAVPSIVSGILGLAVFINIFNLPRSSALVGGMTLSMMTLPTIIIASRSALRQIPSSIRDAARALGASSVQVAFHHIVPLALPGIMTGAIISMARALGETAPLLMIGMMIFSADLPQLPTDASTALPVQIFNWARSPEPGFINNAAAAILVLLIFLGIMNLGAILIRNRFEQKW